MEKYQDFSGSDYVHTSSPSQTIKIRCPDCFKLYAVRCAEIRDSKPRFECLSCAAKFWIPYPECLEQKEMLAFPLSWLDSTESIASKASHAKSAYMRSCPKCGQDTPVDERECQVCSVVIAKYEEALQDDVPGSAFLRSQWQGVLENYDNLAGHQSFLKAAEHEANLEYAASKYGKILSAFGGDEIALKMRTEIESLLQTSMQRSQRARGKRIFGSWFRLSYIMYALPLMLILAGYVVPQLRNMVGVGAALLFLTLTIRIYLKGARS